MISERTTFVVNNLQTFEVNFFISPCLNIFSSYFLNANVLKIYLLFLLFDVFNLKKKQFNIIQLQAMQFAGINGEEVFFQVEDHILYKDSTLNAINLLMSSGEVPGLFTSTELESIVKVLKDEFDRENFEGSLIQYFAESEYN